jgi:hypothetical protein
VELLEEWTMVFQIDSVGGFAQEPLNWEDTEEHDAPPSPNRQVPPFAGNSSKSARLHPH